MTSWKSGREKKACVADMADYINNKSLWTIVWFIYSADIISHLKGIYDTCTKFWYRNVLSIPSESGCKHTDSDFRILCPPKVQPLSPYWISIVVTQTPHIWV